MARLLRVSNKLVLSSRTFASQEKVGFIGLGNMGLPMAANLAKEGHNLVVFDMSKAKCDELKDRFSSTSVGSSPADVAADCSTVITMLPEDAHVLSAYTDGKTGIFNTIQSGSLVIDSSTVNPATGQKVSALATEKGAEMVDAPVSGGVPAAEAGTLAFMVGGSDKAFGRAKPFLDIMGRKVVHCGPSGNGLVAKVCNNLILMISMAGVAEAFNLAMRAGMDPKLFAEVVNSSSGRCWSSDTYNPVPGVMDGVPSSRGYAGGFGCDLAKKDLGLAVTTAINLKTPLPMGQQALGLYALMSQHGDGHLDFGGIFHSLYGAGNTKIDTPPNPNK